MVISDLVKGIFVGEEDKSVNSMPFLSVDSEKVIKIQNEFDEALAFEQTNFEDNSEAWKLYSGFKDGQWEEAVLSAIKDEGRNPFQGNFIRSKVNGLAGGLLKNHQDVDYEPIEGEHTDITRAMRELMYSDKELMDWKASYKDAIIDGLVYVAIEEMIISDRYSPLGNVGFRRVMPGSIILDPNWLTNNSWDLKKVWKTAFLTAEEIKNKYKAKSDQIDNLIRIKNTTGYNDYDNGDENEGYPHYGLNDNYGDKYRVIEYHHIEPEEHTVEITIDGLIVPDITDSERQEWANANDTDLQQTIKRKVTVDVYYVTTICPEIGSDLVLEDKQSNIQIGRLPFFIWSSARINGRNSGIPSLLKSIQQTYNKRESLLDHMISTSAQGGVIIDPDLFGNDASILKLVKENFTNPSFKAFSEPGKIASGRNYFQELPRTQMDYGVVNEINRMLDMSDRLSQQPAASDGRSEGSEESGVLFARKQLQAEVTQTVLSTTLEQYWNEKGEGYLILAKQLYSGVYRQFKVFGEDRVIEINKPSVTQDGEEIENDISRLPRMKVIVTQSPDGITNRTTDRIVNTELLRVVDQSHPLARATITSNLMKTLGNSKLEKAELARAAELESALAEQQIKTNMVMLKLQETQGMMQLQQMIQPQQQQQAGPPTPQQAAEQAFGGGQEQGVPKQGAGNPGASVDGNTRQAIQKR